MAMLNSINPATDELIHSYPEMAEEKVEEILRGCQRAFEVDWKNSSFADRQRAMNRLAGLLLKNSESLALLMAREMGRPIDSGLAEIKKCAWACEFFGENAENFLKPLPIATDAKKSYVAFRPLGVILGIMPWNFPFWQVFRFAVPTLMAGNTCVVKHASNVSGCALSIEELFLEAGFPRQVYGTLLVEGSRERMEAIIKHPVVAGVSLTGSVEAGRSVARVAGECLKKAVLELGGSDPYIVLENADLALAAKVCVTSRLQNSGQSCIAAKRFIVVESVYAEFTNLCLKHMLQIKVGDPFLKETDVGPLAKRSFRTELHRQVEESVAKGARCLLGGNIPEGKGAFYPVTLLADVGPGMPAFHQELFGPVGSIIPVKDRYEALRVANDSPFGLGAAIFTKDEALGEELAAQALDAGNCFVNGMVRSDPRLPFGGIKTSGYGREMSSFGIREFVNIKTVYL